jgi:spore coat polysaccharide biosynthesis protein SpsF
MEALNRVPAEPRVLVCPEDCVSAFAPLAGEAGFEIVAGPEEDVLARYCLAIRRFNITHLIRATGDNPFVFADAAAAIAAEALALGADYAGYGGLPAGAGVEAVNAAALLRAEAETRTGNFPGASPGRSRGAALPGEREHVCPYLYGHPEFFSLHRPLAPPRWRNSARLTVDTPEDYERAKLLYAALSLSAPGEARYRGPEIIAAHKEIFSSGDAP